MKSHKQAHAPSSATDTALGVPSASDALASRPAFPLSDGIEIPAWLYRQHDADFSLDVPEEGFGGWQKVPLVFSRTHTAVVLMHAWDTRARDTCPGWYRVVPYVRRAEAICVDVLPSLLATVRASDLPLFHVVGGGDYYKKLPGYQHAVRLAGPEPPAPPQVELDPIRNQLDAYRRAHGYPGTHNLQDVDREFALRGFAPQARPLGDEGIAENGDQLLALCRERMINHLIYAGFAVNWCMLLSPGGMAEMQRHGLMCSVLRQATTAVENRDSARYEQCKEIALWRVALTFGFVLDVDDFKRALEIQ